MIKMGMGMVRISKNQRILKMMKNVGPGTPRNTEEPQGTPLMQLYVSNVFMTQVKNKWVMSTIEDISETPRVLSSVRAWMESAKYGEDERVEI